MVIFIFAGVSDYAEIVEEEGDYSTPDGMSLFDCFSVNITTLALT